MKELKDQHGVEGSRVHKPTEQKGGLEPAISIVGETSVEHSKGLYSTTQSWKYPPKFTVNFPLRARRESRASKGWTFSTEYQLELPRTFTRPDVELLKEQIDHLSKEASTKGDLSISLCAPPKRGVKVCAEVSTKGGISEFRRNRDFASMLTKVDVSLAIKNAASNGKEMSLKVTADPSRSAREILTRLLYAMLYPSLKMQELVKGERRPNR